MVKRVLTSIITVAVLMGSLVACGGDSVSPVEKAIDEIVSDPDFSGDREQAECYVNHFLDNTSLTIEDLALDEREAEGPEEKGKVLAEYISASFACDLEIYFFSEEESEAQQLEPTPTPTAIPMHPEWTPDNVWRFMTSLASKWPFNVDDYYSDRIINNCGGSRFMTETTFRHYKNLFEPRLTVTRDIRVYTYFYEAEVEWYFENGRNRDSTISFVVADPNDVGYRTDYPDHHRPFPFRIDSYWPAGMEDFC